MSEDLNKQMLEMMKGINQSMQNLNSRIDKIEGGKPQQSIESDLSTSGAIEKEINKQETVLAYQCELPPPPDQHGVKAQFGALRTKAGPIFYNPLVCQEYGEKNIQPNYGSFRVKSFSQTMSKDYFDKNVRYLQTETVRNDLEAQETPKSVKTVKKTGIKKKKKTLVRNKK